MIQGDKVQVLHPDESHTYFHTNHSRKDLEEASRKFSKIPKQFTN